MNQESTRILQFDGLRLFIFLGAFFFHHDLQKYWFFSYCLPFFFVLSGFFITRVILQCETESLIKSLKVFYPRRILRTFPAYFFVLGIVMLLSHVVYSNSLISFTYNIKLYINGMSDQGLQEFYIPHWQDTGVHLWSMSMEEQFYLLFAPIFLFVTARRRLLVVCLLLIAFIILNNYMFISHPNYLYGCFTLAEYLLWGAFGWLIVKNNLLSFRKDVLTYFGLFILALLYGVGKTSVGASEFVQFRPHPTQSVYGLAFMLILIGLWREPNNLIARFLKIKPLSYMGQMSYSFYLVHMFTWQIYRWLVTKSPLLGQIPIFVGTLLLTLLIGFFCWFVIEEPFNKLKKYFPLPKNGVLS